MTKRAKREITLFQYILTISGVQVGFGVLTLPREVAQGRIQMAGCLLLSDVSLLL